MKDQNKTKVQLIAELEDMRGRIPELEQTEIISKRAEEVLWKNEERFSKSVESSIIGMTMTAIDGHFIFVNSALCKMLQYTCKELLDMSFNDVIYPEDAPMNMDYLQKVIQNEIDSFEDEQRCIRKDGSIFWAAIKVSAVKDNSDNFLHFFAHILDITEYRKTKEALLDSETLYRNLIETTSAVAWEVDIASQRFTYISPQIMDISGFPPEKWVDFNFWVEQIHPDDREEAASYCQVETSKGLNHAFEYRMITSDGSIIWISDIVSVIKNQGQPVTLRGYFMDITKRKQEEEALREGENNYRNLVEQSNDSIYVLLGDKYVLVNKAFAEMFGYTKEEILSDNFNFWKIVAPKSREFIKKRIELQESGESVSKTYEFQGLTKDKKSHYLEVNLTYILWNGESAIQGICRDITERKHAEEALRESERKFREMTDLLPQIVYESDLQGNLSFVNKQAFTTFGYSKKEFNKGINAYQIVIPEDRERAKENIQRIIAGKPVENKEYTLFKKDGSTFPVFIYSGLVKKDNKLVGLRGIIINITERKRAVEEKDKLEKQLRRAQKLETVGTLAGGIAHDFNNILAPIMGYAEMSLLNLKETDSLYIDLQYILKAAHRAKELVEQILLFAKQGEKEHRPLSLQLLVREALKLLRPSIPTTVEIQQHVNDSCEKVRADSSQIHQVIVNLCTNAWQAMEEKGGKLTIELNLKRVDIATVKLHPILDETEYACLSIIDTGPGMNEQVLDRIFEPFFTTKEINKGTGLGLSVVHGIVRSHKGDILVYSEPGKGTEFHVYLPIIKTDEEVKEQQSTKIVSGTENIMIVDDEVEIAEMIKRMLENFGYKTEVFKTGIDVMKAYRQRPDKYDLLVCDLTMPQMTGLDIADQLHKEDPNFPVVIMTGSGDSISGPTQDRYGINQIIGKPITLIELTSTVRKVLDN